MPPSRPSASGVGAVLPAFAFLPVFVFRIRNEEEVLVRELAGYDEYRRKVRHRLVPLVW